MNQNYVPYEKGSIPLGYGGTLSGAAMTTTRDAPTPRDTIQQALDEQAARLTDLHKVISSLEERLVLVLGPPNPSNGQAGPPSDPGHVLDRVRLGNALVVMACERLGALMDRLQL